MKTLGSIKKEFDRLTKKYLVAFINIVPGEKRFGAYRFLPFFFAFGASLEYLMIHWKVGPHQVNFYTSLKRREAERLVKERYDLEDFLNNSDKASK